MAPGLDLVLLSREEVRECAFRAGLKSSDVDGVPHSSEYPELNLKGLEV
jgi:hypothetical protein